MGKTYTEAQLREQGLIYFEGDVLATNIWINKYALKTKKGEYKELSPDDTIRRLTSEIERAELKYPNPLTHRQIYEMLKDFKYFIFGGSILFGLGNDEQVSSLGNCFFIDNGSDSYGGIFNTEESMVQLMKRRGGVGITLEHLRPETSLVNNAAKTSTGAVSFMDRFSYGTREVAQDGRRGALMITMHVDHPDILAFITKKDDLSKVTGANISVKVTDKFMEAVERNEDYYLCWPIKDKKPEIKESLPYNSLHILEDGSHVRRVKAKDIWDAIVKQAHKNAEPGVIFWDNVIKESPADAYASFGFTTKGTNPCGEVPLSPYDSCRLGSINLFPLIDDPFTKDAQINWMKLAKHTRIAQRFMDDIVELEEEKVINIIAKINSDPEDPEIKRNELKTWEKVLSVLRKGRRTGVGVLGLGDALAALGIKFGTPEATKTAEEIHKCIAINSYKESINLAKERGHFPIWNPDTESPNSFIRRVISDNFDNREYREYLDYGRRNIATLSIAPTGSLAILAQTTSGIEPVFKVYYRRRRKVNPGEKDVNVTFVDPNGDSWEEYNVLHYPFVKWFIQHRKEVFKDLIERGEEVPEDLSFEGVLKEFKNLPEEILNQIVSDSPWAGSESHDIDYMEKIRMQGAIQKWVDHSISVTHNLPEKITVAEVNNIYFQGWKAGCKGLTIYREGSRTGVLLAKKDKEEFKETKAPKRPPVLEADYFIAKAQGKEFAVIIGLWPETNKPFEIFAFENPPMSKNTKGKTIKVKKGHYKFVNGEFQIENLQLAAGLIEERMLTLTASMLLRHGAPIKHVNHIIQKIDDNITSFSSVVRRSLSRYIPAEVDGEACPICGDKLIMQDGCVKCVNPECGYSRCG
jgi:ribonucleoside-diphosphate reductase alpha chain